MHKAFTTKEFIQKAKLIHSDKYNYSKVNYIHSHIKICIICPEHDEFYQLPNNHLHGYNCPKCSSILSHQHLTLTIQNFIQKAKLIHENKYDYSKVNYINNHTKICIICTEHREFWQHPSSHLKGHSCPKCALIISSQKNQFNKNEIIKKANEIHNNKYDYSKINYIGIKNKIHIICPEHGEFWQRPDHHLNGSGCPKCKRSKGEEAIEKYLKEHNIQYETQKRFKDCKNIKPLPFDFYLPDYNLLIEYDGNQHFKPIKYWNGEQGFQRTQFIDNLKNQYSQDNNIKLLRISYIDFPNINHILGCSIC